MMKILGGLFIITATSLIGYQQAGTIRQEYQELLYIRRMMYLLQSEIRYARAYLGEAFITMGHKLREPYREWMLCMGSKLDQKDSGLFSEIWENGIQEHLACVKISSEERARLIELGSQFATADIEMQIRTLELYQEQLWQVMTEKKDGMQAKIRLCHCLGVMAGIFITVLLI